MLAFGRTYIYIVEVELEVVYYCINDNVRFNVLVTSRDLQTSRLGLVSVSAIDVSCPSLLL